MKKKLLFGIIAVISLAMISGCGQKVDNSNSEATSPDDFMGIWSAEKLTLRTEKGSDDSYYINVIDLASESESNEWNYSCSFNNKNNIMECVGTKVNYKYKENQAAERIEKYKDGKATFSLKNSKIVWQDEIENAGKDLKFKINK